LKEYVNEGNSFSAFFSFDSIHLFTKYASICLISSIKSKWSAALWHLIETNFSWTAAERA
jgi:hypothetical protein